ncbi:thiamine ABC transporter substrate binding subunit [Mannheimia varigena]|uniref:thiamine ABC transporter substrate binding subunit n=1 Tax=Mannheimia varigena TaxID=85404 RepID=UPI0015B5FB4B|nr:thiamine ABC transporter substrate binding subunit [Mannheimia varigena]MDY2946794.1 thiamine ABC transporter substrate binding subunit [Mannheimia varigena]QLD33482.1 thiamine ABC transporter substrate binding subunit [Mannheimia varigena]
MKFILSSLALLSAATSANSPTLTVYTYSSFASEYGPAPKLEQNFEKECNCDLKFIPLDDSVTMFNRVRLEGEKTKADVVLGIDNFLQPEAEKSGLFTEFEAKTKLEIKDKIFFPYDTGSYAFIYDKEKLKNPPKSLKELVERQDLKIIYQDPRTSSVGRGFLIWINQVYGDEAPNAWKALAKHTVTVGKGWSETYGAFLKGESDLVLSYTTSPLYHKWHENTDKYVAAPFEEGHLVQVENAAIVKMTKQKALANQFLEFLHNSQAQHIISYHNVMSPVIKEGVDPAFSEMPEYKSLEFTPVSQQTIQKWLSEWSKSW